MATQKTSLFPDRMLNNIFNIYIKNQTNTKYRPMENKGKHSWELQLQSGREREGGKRKPCEAASLKSVKNQMWVWWMWGLGHFVKEGGKVEKGGEEKKKAVPAANSPSTKFWPRCRSKAAIWWSRRKLSLPLRCQQASSDANSREIRHLIEKTFAVACGQHVVRSIPYGIMGKKKISLTMNQSLPDPVARWSGDEESAARTVFPSLFKTRAHCYTSKGGG